MKKLLPILGLLMLCAFVNAQSTSALPTPVYNTMVHASTGAEVSMIDNNSGSVSIAASYLQSYITDINVARPAGEPAASISCKVHDTEIVAGTIYLTKTGGAIVFNINGTEYVNALNTEGADFFRAAVLTASL